MSDRIVTSSILCPVDLSDQSVPVVRLAASLARACSVPLVVVHASTTEVPPYFTPQGVELLEAELDHARIAARQRLATLVEGAPGAEIRVEDGDPLTIIQRLSAFLHPSMIVMGTHGRGGLARFVDGSVAEDLVHSSDIPVLTVGPTDDIATAQTIVCAVTDTELSRTSLSWAIHLAECLRRSLTILHVVEPGASHPISDLCEWAGRDRAPGCQVQEVIREGNAADEILRLAGELRAGLLVIGAQHKLISDKTVIGATVEKLLRHSPCPVLTVLGDRHPRTG